MINNNLSRVIILALAGVVAGLLVFTMFNPSTVRDELAGHVPADLTELYRSAMLLGIGLAATLGGMLAVANEIGSPALRIAVRTLSSAGIGAVLGAISGAVGQFVFSFFGMAMPIIGLIIGRTIGWAIIGAGAGIGVGFVLGSWKRAGMGALGGLIGGAAGGLMFDVLGIITGGGSISRLFGFVIIGAATGAAIAFVEEVAKQSWITVLTGAREGKTYILTKPATTIGRDELADIPLFGDPSIAKRHAVLNTVAYTVSIAPIGGPVMVNGASAAPNTQVRDGDIIGIGRVSLRVNQKVGQYAPSRPPQRWHDPLALATQAGTFPGLPLTAPTGTIKLTIVSGPYSGHWYQSGPGLLRIGREDTCSINLSHDAKVSRVHAEISWDGSSWILQDPGSTNGLWLNSERITSRTLSIGDHVGVGQTVLRVDSL